MKFKFYFQLTVLFFISQGIMSSPFVTKWDLGIATNVTNEIAFEVVVTGPISYAWETIPAGQSGSGTFLGNELTISNLPSFSIIRLSIDTPNLKSFYFSDSSTAANLIDVEQWGTTKWSSMNYAFKNCKNLQISASDLPDFSLLNDLTGMFWECSSLTGPANIGQWNTSTVRYFSYLFFHADHFNQAIDSWNTSNGLAMKSMFNGAHDFNQSLASWNTELVEDMSYMFASAYNFNQPIGSWNTMNVSSINSMFEFATSFNQPIGDWNTNNLISMSAVFDGATSFNQPIGNWNTSKVTNMAGVFNHASSFNQAIDDWNTEMVIDLNSMFYGAANFNQPIGSWNTGNVGSMSAMFYGATNFNQPIGSWNTIFVYDMNSMFDHAENFNQPIGTWNTANVRNMANMFNGAAKFNQPLLFWNTKNVEDMEALFANARDFNQDIGSWNTSKVVYMSRMFENASEFNQPIGNWDISNVNYLTGMFDGAKSFNQPIGNWDISNLNNLNNLFKGASSFNQPLESWNTSKVSSMDSMFFGASSFNQPLNNWNTKNVGYMNAMFENALSFNQPLNKWNTRGVRYMNNMFKNAIHFNQSLCYFDLRNKTEMNHMLDSCGMDCETYSNTLKAWSTNPTTSKQLKLGASSLKFDPHGQLARTALIANNAWTIHGDEFVSLTCGVSKEFLFRYDTVCQGYFIYNHGETGIYIDTLIGQGALDTILYLDLTVLPTNVIPVYDTKTICKGESYYGYTTSGVFHDTIASFHGCDTVRNIYLGIYPQHIPVLDSKGFEISVVNGKSGFQYEWYLNGELLDQKEQKLSIRKNGNYIVRMEDLNQCKTFDTIIVNYLDPIMMVYPNPVKNKCEVEVPLDDAQDIKIRLVDIMGRTLYQEIFRIHQAQVFHQELDFTKLGLVDGIYFLHVIGESEKYAPVKLHYKKGEN